jgi:periplasmic divalent cation tolerance protein
MKRAAEMKEKPILLMVTAATRDEAENLGEALIGQGLATRGSVISAIHSFWMAAGKLERSHEAMLLLTTSEAHAKRASAYIREHHSFEAPQIMTLQVADETTG